MSLKDVKKLDKLRKMFGYSQETVSRLLGVSARSYHRWLKGIAKPSLMAQDRVTALINTLENR